MHRCPYTEASLRWGARLIRVTSWGTGEASPPCHPVQIWVHLIISSWLCLVLHAFHDYLMSIILHIRGSTVQYMLESFTMIILLLLLIAFVYSWSIVELLLYFTHLHDISIFLTEYFIILTTLVGWHFYRTGDSAWEARSTRKDVEGFSLIIDICSIFLTDAWSDRRLVV